MNENAVHKFDDLIEFIARRFHNVGASSLENMDITLPQFILMKLISDMGTPKMTDLANELGVTMGNTTAMSDRLIKEDYIERKNDPEDRRIVRLSLTKKGADLIKRAEKIRKENMSALLKRISIHDQEAMLKIMEKLVDSIKNEKGENKK